MHNGGETSSPQLSADVSQRREPSPGDDPGEEDRRARWLQGHSVTVTGLVHYYYYLTSAVNFITPNKKQNIATEMKLSIFMIS